MGSVKFADEGSSVSRITEEEKKEMVTCVGEASRRASSCLTMTHKQLHVHRWRNSARVVVIGGKQVKQTSRQVMPVHYS